MKEGETDNYEIETFTKKLVIGDAQDVVIRVSYTSDSVIKTDYTGNALTTSILEGKYTAKVYTDEDDPRELTDAVLTGAWCDASKNELEEGKAPKDAGTWYYKLSFEDANGTYSDAEAYIPVQIEPVKLTIVPMLDQTEYANGVSASDVTKQASYKVLYADGTEKTADQLPEGFWGTWYDEGDPGDTVDVPVYDEDGNYSSSHYTMSSTPTEGYLYEKISENNVNGYPTEYKGYDVYDVDSVVYYDVKQDDGTQVYDDSGDPVQYSPIGGYYGYYGTTEYGIVITGEDAYEPGEYYYYTLPVYAKFYYPVYYSDETESVGPEAQEHTQAYQPSFTVQKVVTTTTKEKDKDATTKVTPSEYNDELEIVKDTETGSADTTLVTTKTSYRLVFSGKKSVYDEDGNETTSEINYGSGNYVVDISDDAIANNAVPLSLVETEKLTIDVSGIEADNSFTDPKTKVVDGSMLYANRGEYKKAKAGSVITSGTDSRLVYTWQYLDPDYLEDLDAENGNALFDKDGNARFYSSPVEDPGTSGTTEQKAAYQTYTEWATAWADAWEDYGDWVRAYENSKADWTASPSSIGVYRLEVSLDDPTNTYSASPAYVYYVIQPKEAAVAKLTGELKAYAGDTVAQALARFQHDDEEDTGSYLGLSYFKATLSAEDATTKKVTATEGEAIESEYAYYDLFEYNYDYDYYTFDTDYLQIEEGTEKDGKTTWTALKTTDVLAKDKTYRVSLSEAGVECLNGKSDWGQHPYDYNREDSTADYYTISQKLSKYNVVLDTSYYENIAASLTVAETTALTITVDETKLTSTTKTYDGQGIDTTEILNAVTLKKADNTDVTAEAKQYLSVWFVDQGSNTVGKTLASTRKAENTIHAGTYKPEIRLSGTDVYKMDNKSLDTVYTINKRSATLTPVVKNGITGGTYISYWASTKYDYDIAVRYYIINGYDAEGFVDGDIKGIEYITFDAYENGTQNSVKNALYRYLKGGKQYYAIATAISNDDEYYGVSAANFFRRNYNITYKTAEFTPDRVSAQVLQAATALSNDVSVPAGTSAFAHTVTPLEGIPANADDYNADVYDVETAWSGKNIFTAKIYVPRDVRLAYGKNFGTANAFTYRNSIEKAGGRIVEKENTNITVAFDASLQNQPEFTILWDEDFAETFTMDLRGAVLEDDLSEAVAPKSLAFNGASAKMVVGGTQQLDVKLTKFDMADIIYLGYSVDDSTVLQITDNGFITALKKGTASVTVYPCVEVNGKPKAISGAKTATLKITVSDVSAPKIGTVSAGDTSFSYSYTVPEGYRREVYVLAGNIKPAEFEEKLAGVKNGDFSGFAYYSFTRAENVDSKGYHSVSDAGALTPDTQYTLYVRNVSGLRTLDGGSTVASSAAGAVKTFMTVKAQVKELYLSFDSKTVEGSYVTDANVDLNDDWIYVAALSNKSAQVSVKGDFAHRYAVEYAEADDEITLALPLSAAMKKNYTAPKLAYYVCTYDDWMEYDDWSDLTEKKQAEYVYDANNDVYCRKTSDLAAISSSGKLTLKGKGRVRIFVKDLNQENVIDYRDLYIAASPDSFSGKAISLKPGESKDIRTVLTYKQKSTNVVNYESVYAALSITADSSEFFSISGNRITALKAGGKLQLTVSDSVVKANGGKDITINVSSGAMETIKALKASEVRDHYAKLSFGYGVSNNNVKFRIQLQENKGKVVFDRLVSYEDVYDDDTNSFVYDTDDNADVTLTRLSSYTASVTPIYNGVSGKTATVKFKTTDIPASYYNLAAGATGGSSVYVYRGNDEETEYNVRNVTLKSGNTYVLYAPMTGVRDNRSARIHATDSLTWKSTNTAVGSVKATAGSYSASFKAVKPGYTNIELTSKITKCVIARYTVLVNAVGDGNGYYELNNPYPKSTPVTANNGDGVNDEEGQDFITISADNSCSYQIPKKNGAYVAAGAAQWYVFTAPSFGDYTVVGAGNNCTVKYYEMVEGKLSEREPNNGVLDDAAKGTSLYVKVINATRSRKYSYAYLSRCITKTQVSLGENKVKANDKLVFTAPEDNVYTFSYVDKNDVEQKTSVALVAGVNHTPTVNTNVTSGKYYTLTISRRTVSGYLSTSAESAISVAKDAEVWYAFKPAATGNYKFTFSANAAVEIYDSLGDVEKSSTLTNLASLSLQNGKEVFFKITSAAATAEIPASVTASVAALAAE